MMGAISVSAFVFLYPDKSAVLWEIAGTYATLNSGQMLGNIGQGAKRYMQGGTIAPLQIVAPIPARYGNQARQRAYRMA